MIAIDTNVLLRYLLADDIKQHNKAKKLIIERCPVLITDVVLVETVWTLTGKRYRFDKVAICAVVRALIGDGGFAFENSQAVWFAFNEYKNAKVIAGKGLDFADALIGSKSIAVANAKGFELEGFYSFDKAALKLKYAKSP